MYIRTGMLPIQSVVIAGIATLTIGNSTKLWYGYFRYLSLNLVHIPDLTTQFAHLPMYPVFHGLVDPDG